MADKSVLDSLQCVIAPMVSQSDAPFRTLCLKYGATVAYTEMLYTENIVKDHDYLPAYLPSMDHSFFNNQYTSRPLVVQVCGNDPATMAEAAVKVMMYQPDIDAIDINLGCPQDRARDGLFGSFLLDKQHWDRVFACVKACSEVLASYDKPLFCKIRLIEGADIIDLTTKFCRGLIANGCKVICIHGRTRGSTKKRRCGPADLSAIATIAKTIQAEYGGSIPVISNGNITTTTDVLQALKETHPCCGVMSAEGILANPGLFAGVAQHIRKFGSFTETALVAATTGKRAHSDTDEDAQPQRKTEMKPLLPPSRLALFQEYCALSEQYRAAGGWSQLDTHFARGRSSCAPGTASATAVASTSISTGSIDNNQVAGKSAVDSESGFCASEEKIVSNDASEGAGAVSSAVFPSPVTALRPESSTENKEAAAYVREPRQIYIARQHLSWMLGKSGHGRMVRYEYIGAFYKKHVHLMQDMNAATCIFDLLCIAERCLPSC